MNTPFKPMQFRRAADLGDDGTNDLLVSDVVRTNEKQAWFVREHLRGDGK